MKLNKKSYSKTPYKKPLSLPGSLNMTPEERAAQYRLEDVKRLRILRNNPVEIQWRVCPRADLNPPSSAEQLIMQELNKYNIMWYREVEFMEHMKSEYGYYRYDFYIPKHFLVIEYDGTQYHNSHEAILNDREKTRFCNEVKLNLVRYNRKHYYKMAEHIRSLMREYGISRK